MDTPDFTGATWRKSSHSGDNGGQCVEVAFVHGAVGLRDSKYPGDGPALSLSLGEFSTFLGAVTAGVFGL